MASPKLALDDLGCLILVGGIFSWLMIRSTGHPTEWAVAFSVAGVLALVWYFQRGLRNSIARWRTGNVFVDLLHVTRSGQGLELDVICASPEARREVERVSAHLLRGSDLLVSHQLERGAEGRRATRWSGELPIPAGLTPGSYTVQVEVEIPNWPDWVHTYALTVLAPKAPRPPELQVTARAAAADCPYCKDSLAGLPRESLLQCGDCGTVFHAECVYELGRCTTRGCSRSQPRPRVRG